MRDNVELTGTARLYAQCPATERSGVGRRVRELCHCLHLSFSVCKKVTQQAAQPSCHNRISDHGDDKERVKIAKVNVGSNLKSNDCGSGGTDYGQNIKSHKPMPQQRRNESDAKEYY